MNSSNAGTTRPDTPAGARAEGGRALTAVEVEDWLIDKLSEELEIDAATIDPREPFANYGLDSMRAIGVSGDLEDWLDLRLPATLIWDYPTITALSEYLVKELAASKAGAAPALKK